MRRGLSAICLKDLFCLLSLLLCAGSLSHAQEPSREAERAVERFYTAFHQQRWTESAALVHPEALAHLKQTLADTADSVRDPGQRKQLLQAFGGVETADAFRQVSAEIIFVRLFQLVSRRAPAEFAANRENTAIRVIGSVAEGDLRHVVFRTSSRNQPAAKSAASVASLKRDTNQWKVLDSTEFNSLLQTIRKAGQ